MRLFSRQASLCKVHFQVAILTHSLTEQGTNVFQSTGTRERNMRMREHSLWADQWPICKYMLITWQVKEAKGASGGGEHVHEAGA